MIFLYSGTPGSGKSLHQAERIYYRLKAGYPVIANFDINLSIFKGRNIGQFCYVDNSVLTPGWLVNFSRSYFENHRFSEGAIQLYIDESQLLFNAREWQTKGRKEWLSFFTQHRKFGFDIVLVAQFDRMLDRQLRCLIEYEYIHRKVTNHGKFGSFLGAFFRTGLFVHVKVWYPLKEKVDSHYFHGKKRFFDLYNSYNTFNTEDTVLT